MSKRQIVLLYNVCTGLFILSLFRDDKEKFYIFIHIPYLQGQQIKYMIITIPNLNLSNNELNVKKY